MTWTVKNFDCNAQVIKNYDILKYREDLIKTLKKKCKTKEEFSEQMRREMMYRYWSKAEFELIIRLTDGGEILLLPWCGSRDPENQAVYVTKDKSFNWKEFAEIHINKQIFKNEAKIDIFDQLEYKWDEFINYCWNSNVKG